MARQADDAHIVAEVLAAKLRSDAHALRKRVHLLLQLKVSERAAAGAPAVDGHTLVSNKARQRPASKIKARSRKPGGAHLVGRLS